MDKMQIKNTRAAIEQKADGENGALHIRAYVLAFGNIDSYGDIIEPGACDEFLKSENADRMRLCYQHDLDQVIGVITAKGVDGRGMWIEADVLDTTIGADVQKLLKAGAIDEFSIGYVANKWSYSQTETGEQVRHLEAITIWEASPVTRAANPLAVLLDAKSEEAKNALGELSDDELVALKSAVGEEIARRIVSKL